MWTIEVSSPSLPSKRITAETGKCLVGKDNSCDISLDGWKVSKKHAEFVISSDRVFIRDLGSTFGTLVNEQKIDTHGPIQSGEVIKIGVHSLRVTKAVAAHLLDASASRSSVIQPDGVEVSPRHVSPQITSHVSLEKSEVPSDIAGAPVVPREKYDPTKELTFQYRSKLHALLLEAFDVRRTDVHRMSDDELRSLTEKLIAELMEKLKLPAGVDKKRLSDEVRDEAIGLGLLEPLLADPTITEIMVNGSSEVFAERLGKIERLPMAFTSDRAVMGIIERIVAPIGRRIDESSPMVDARLKDGSRVNAVIPPLAIKGPSITIRKFSQKKLDHTDLMKFGSANEEMIKFLKVCVEHHKNILISGGTGSGKTTLLNILSNFIPNGDRIVTIEDAAELQLHHDNIVSLEARPANMEGKGQVAIRDLVKNSLRMRPDRIVVGECRGGEALDMLQAMNTGHDGSLTTAHANTPRDMLARLEVMVLMAGMELPVTAIREQIASAVDIIVQQNRFSCGSRKITSIVEVTGVESGKIQLQEVFAFVQTGRDQNFKTVGHFTGRGFVPEFYEELSSIGVPLDLAIFKERATGAKMNLSGAE